MTRSARLLDLIQALRRRRRPVPAASLATELGVSLRTIYRDVATLTAQGARIEGEAGLGYVLRPGYFLPPLMFTADELDAVVLGLRYVSRRGDAALVQAASDAMAKVSSVLPQSMQDAAGSASLLAAPQRSADTPVLAQLRRAIRAEVKLRLHYADKAGATTQRVVWPIVIGFFDQAELLAAWCELRGDFRQFRADRILCAELLNERYPKRQRILLAEWRLREGLDASS